MAAFDDVGTPVEHVYAQVYEFQVSVADCEGPGVCDVEVSAGEYGGAWGWTCMPSLPFTSPDIVFLICFADRETLRGCLYPYRRHILPPCFGNQIFRLRARSRRLSQALLLADFYSTRRTAALFTVTTNQSRPNASRHGPACLPTSTTGTHSAESGL